MSDVTEGMPEAGSRLRAALVESLRSLNPWWSGRPGPGTPPFHRAVFPTLQRLLGSGLTPAVILRGPRRVGKTVLVRQIIEDLLAGGAEGRRILYLPFDEIEALGRLRAADPLLAIARWFEAAVLGETFNESARGGRVAYLCLDEVQNLRAWAPQLKHLVDNHDVRVLATGSSALRIEAGRESLAGRVTTLTIGTLLLREIAGLRSGQAPEALLAANGLKSLLQRDFWQEAVARGRREAELRDEAFRAFSARGGYPVAHQHPAVPWAELADQLNESVIGRALRDDLRRAAGREEVQEAGFLVEVFRLCCRYAGQAPGPSVFVPEIQQAVAAPVGWRKVRNTLRLFDDTLLLRLVPPLELRLKQQSSPAKVCLCDHALRASWLQEVVPLDPEGLAASPHLTDLAGHLAESALGYFLASLPNLHVAYFPPRGIEPEVDFVLTVGTRRIPVEVKYRRHIDPHDDTRGLRAFLEKTVYNAPFGLLVTLEDDVTVYDPRIIPIPLSSFLWVR